MENMYDLRRVHCLPLRTGTATSKQQQGLIQSRFRSFSFKFETRSKRMKEWRMNEWRNRNPFTPEFRTFAEVCFVLVLTLWRWHRLLNKTERNKKEKRVWVRLHACLCRNYGLCPIAATRTFLLVATDESTPMHSYIQSSIYTGTHCHCTYML